MKHKLCKDCGTADRRVQQTKTLLGDKQFYVRCPNCKKQTDNCDSRTEAWELWDSCGGVGIFYGNRY